MSYTEQQLKDLFKIGTEPNEPDFFAMIETIFDQGGGGSLNFAALVAALLEGTNVTLDVDNDLQTITINAGGKDDVTVTTQMTIMNGETLPVGVEPDILYIDTGMITGDARVTIDQIPGYKLVDGDFESPYVQTCNLEYTDDDGGVPVASIAKTGRLAHGIYQGIVAITLAKCDGLLEVVGDFEDEEPKYRFILKFEKSKI